MSDIVVYGRGKTAQSLLKMLQKLHLDAIMYDDATGFDGNGKFSENSLVLLSPGVPPQAKGVQLARQNGANVVGELEFCFPYSKGKCISVTGTNGKTTTCEMIYHVLQNCGVSSRLLGNGGVPFSSQVLEVVENEIVVLESSSFQLLDCKGFAPFVSVVTNLAVDHLNYHGSFEQYAKAKENNFVHQKEGYALFNLDDGGAVNLSRKAKCKTLFYSVNNTEANCYYDGDNVVLRCDGQITRISARFLKQYAKHNLSNSLGAILACACVGIPPNLAVDALQTYALLPHRLQQVANFCGVTFIDDSKATNVHATVSALSCFSQNVGLILGGSDKGENYDPIFETMGTNVKLVVAVGETAADIRQCGQKHGVDVKIYDDFSKATRYCFEQMKNIGGVVLMSNACASFDLFSGYGERGDYFQKAVKEIQSDTKKN
ncbi:MAG: UDP-N-acetylmuramoyl-L-alanine--D-glutamate ligase [Clostridiales bacterium]|nr:UDP-N-acetylmuramoyl-L-alanine--D-glutamate ligase [Clostridiales bacterium]